MTRNGKRSSRIDASQLARFAFFDDLSVSKIRDLTANASVVRFSAGEQIFRQYEDADRFFFLLEGNIRVVRVNENGEQMIIRTIPVGEMFGIAPALGRTTYPATAVAAVECIAVAWPVESWASLAERFPRFAKATQSAVGERLEETHEKFMDLAKVQVEYRLAKAVLTLLRQAGKDDQGAIKIDMPVTRQNLADMIGTTLHTVSRIMSDWQSKGIVKSGRGTVTVVLPAKLAEIIKRSGSP